MKEINERWDCQREMIPNHFCVILDKTRFSQEKLSGFYGIIRKNHNKSGYYLIKEMHIVYIIGSPSGEPMFSLCKKWRKFARHCKVT